MISVYKKKKKKNEKNVGIGVAPPHFTGVGVNLISIPEKIKKEIAKVFITSHFDFRFKEFIIKPNDIKANQSRD